MHYQLIANYISAFSAFCAAALWFWASRATVESDYDRPLQEGIRYLNFMGARGPIQITETGKRIDVVETLALQGRLNSFAAMAAGTAAGFQGLAILLPGT